MTTTVYKEVIELARAKGYKPYIGMENYKIEKNALIELFLIQQWLRTDHKIHLFLDYTYYDGFHYGYKWVRGNGDYGEWWKDNDGEEPDGWDDPDVATLEAIKNALNLL